MFVLSAATLMGGVFYVTHPDFILPAVLVASAVVAFGTIAILWRIHQSVNASNSKQIFDVERICEFTDTGMHASGSDGGHGLTLWSYIIKAEVRSPFIFLFPNKLVFFVVPEYAFETEADRDELVQFLESKKLLKTKR
jgi:hypothetical protein